MLYAQTATSTQTILDKNPKLTSYLPDGLVCLASQQIKGRGRGRNPWISPDGCLQFSLLLKYPQFGPNPQASPVLLQYLFGLAVVEAVRSCPGYEEIPLQLKWPNDVYAEIPVRSSPSPIPSTSPKVRRVKISGTLTNSSFGKDGLTLVIGTGVNCHNALPTTSVNELIREYNRHHGTSLPIWSEELLLARILAQFEVFYQRFLLNQTNCTPFTPRTTATSVCSALPALGKAQTQATHNPREVAYQRHSLTSPASLAYPTLGGTGIEPFLAMYYRRWLHSDQLATLQDHNHVQVRIKGITTDYGYLETIGVRDGQRYVLQPGGNSFDMMAGLIGRKKV
ncbi:biotin holocarboxylase synthetase [Dimargaris verticillata]|uniref:Biotin holocarboxylase synthetase n=1 Tax=Dimargaris verticillata TaxID=2761393 RepID=A0A9W8AVI9_9FUNG|nr:biotin holocarboxylase synthetase [Dimargaris verticillata]